MRRASFTAGLFAALTACSSMRTEVLVVVDTDMAVPDELDEIRIDLIGPSGETRRSEGSIGSASELPKTLGIVDATNREMRSVRVTVTGLRRGANVVQRRAVFTFVPGETRILRMDLLRRCAGVSCASDETCGESGCRSREIAPSELVPYDPSRVDRLDAEVPDAGVDAGCTIAIEACNARDDDCDGLVDEDFALATDVAHCGSCENACALAPDNASSACVLGECALACDPGFADCNGLIEDGCEAVLSAPSHCGSCENACGGATPFCADGASGLACVASCPLGTTDCGGACVDVTSDPLRCGGCETRCVAPPNAIATCTASVCGSQCDQGFANCDGDDANGCESDLMELDHCGRCGQLCARPGAIVSCASGACETIGCETFRADCDGDVENGCEADVSSDVMRCGECDIACPTGLPSATTTCELGRCRMTCDPGFASCDEIAINGCEQSLAQPEACGACGIACTDATPFCGAAGGGYACTSGCADGTRLCGTSCVDTRSDPLHCGACDVRCPTGANARSSCEGGQCALVCNAGWDDCEGDLGCETYLGTSITSCGSCGHACVAPPNAIAECRSGACGYRCEVGWEDCNERPEDGCEVSVASDVTNCGACGNRCALSVSIRDIACVEGVCQIASCTSAYADCDRSFTTGCEVDTQLSRLHCGSCGEACGSGQRCCNGVCLAPSECP